MTKVDFSSFATKRDLKKLREQIKDEFLDITSVAKYKKKHIESYKYFKDRFDYDPEVVLEDD